MALHVMTENRVRSALLDYLSRQSDERAQLRETLGIIASRVPETVIFGGMLRELGWGRAREFNSDIDLVSNVRRLDLYAAVRQFEPSKNRFGGFRFSVGKRLFDIWALEDTWAIREQLTHASGFEALLQTTFFGVDSAFFHLSTKKYSHSDAHLKGIRERVLEINLLANPYPQKMTRRAIRMALGVDLSIAPTLAAYMVEHCDIAEVSPLEEAFMRALKGYLDRGEKGPFRFQPQIPVFSA